MLHSKDSDSRTGNAEATVAKYEVAIQQMQFDPGTVTIAPGDTVEWTNRMGMPHTVSPDHGEFPGSGPLGPNETFSHRFDAAGSITYHCDFHPDMTGQVVVA
jgi:plastocyanin